MILFVIFLSTLLLSITIIRLFLPVAVSMGLVDKPGGHKIHQDHIPLIGGIAIYISLITAWIILPLLGITSINAIFLGSSGLLFTIGLLDDRFSLSVKIRLAMQIFAALLLIYSNVVLDDLGCLLSEDLLVTGIFAVPITVISTVGVINSLNMIDGLDGLAGLVSVVILSLLLIVSTVSGANIQALITVCILGSVTGFLMYNMRRPGIKKAKVFMGDAGSTLLGFIFAYLLISLSQGDQRAFAPVIALWLFAIPLMDTLGVMLRRVWLKRSPFLADRGHLHHLMMDSGFRVRHVVYIIAVLQLILGVLGLSGYYLEVSDSILFLIFFLIFLCYTYALSRPSRAVYMLRTIHRHINLTVRGMQKIYIGNLNAESAIEDVDILLGDNKYKYHFELYKYSKSMQNKALVYAVVDSKEIDNVKWLIGFMKKQLKRLSFDNAICIRQYIVRSQENDRRKVNITDKNRRRLLNDRRSQTEWLVYTSEKETDKYLVKKQQICNSSTRYQTSFEKLDDNYKGLSLTK